MITEKVIQDIYKSYRKPHRDREELRIPYFLDLLKKHHKLKADDDEIVIEDLDDFNPFRRFLVRSLHAILEFDRMVAFVFPHHILFLGKEDNTLRVNFKPEKKKSFLGRLFGSGK